MLLLVHIGSCVHYEIKKVLHLGLMNKLLEACSAASSEYLPFSSV